MSAALRAQPRAQEPLDAHPRHGLGPRQPHRVRPWACIGARSDDGYGSQITAPDPPWAIEFILGESIGDRWVYRRNRQISVALSDLARVNADGLPHLVPAVQLLAKAKDMRPRDDSDFPAAFALLDAGERAWLRTSLAADHPSHPWLSVLAGSDSGQ